MQLKEKSNLVVLAISSLFIIACGGDPKNGSGSAVNDSISKQASQADSSAHSAMAFALPAPLQIATVLKNSNVTFSEKMLVSSKQVRSYPSDYARAINLGVYTTDLGYSTVFGQKQTTLNYYKEVNNLLNDLHIPANLNRQNLKRFEGNIDNTDSLCTIILGSFGQWQSYFQENKREEVGLYILAGTFIEGLYLTLNHPPVQKTEAFKNLIGQQKLFLDNILELSNYMDKKPDFDDLYSRLGAIQQAYESINVSVKTDKQGGSTILCSYTPEQLSALSAKVGQVRNEILK